MTDNTFFNEIDDSGSGVTSSSNRGLLVLAGVAGAVVLAAGGYFLLGSGSSSNEALVVPVHHKAKATTQPVAKTPTSVPAKAAGKVIPAASTARLGRDPFLALYVAPVLTATTGVAPGATAPATTGGSTTPTVVQPQNYALKLTRVYGSGNQLTAVFSVGGKTQLAKVGSVFGATQELKLLSLQQGTKGVWTAVVQEGDGQPFDVPAGQTMYVR